MNGIHYDDVDLLKAPKVFDYIIVKLIKYYKDKDGWYNMDVHGKFYNDKSVANNDARGGYVQGRLYASAGSSIPPHSSTNVLPLGLKPSLDVFVDHIFTTSHVKEDRLIACFDVMVTEVRERED